MTDVATELRPRRWKLLKSLGRLVVFLAMAVGVGFSISSSLDKFREQEFSLAKLHYGWLTAAGALYLIGSAPAWLFWRRAMWAMGGRPGRLASLRAYYIGHLGKYVPGKGLVVVVRAALVAGPQVGKTVAATCVFVETLSVMAVGAVLAAAYIAIAYRDQYALLAAAIACAIAAGVPIVPPVFRRIVRLLRVHRLDPQIDEALQGINYSLMAGGVAMLAAGWLAMGLSLWAVLQALPAPPDGLDDLTRVLPQLTACVALALVIGFVTMMPGGIGSRELVITQFVTIDYGPVAGVASAFLLRFVWLLAELIAAAVFYWLPARREAETHS